MAATVACATAADDVSGPDLGAGGPTPLPPAQRGDEAVQTDSLAYTAVTESGTGDARRYRFRVVTRFTNRMAAPVYLASCGPLSTSPTYGVVLVVGVAAGGWGSIFSPFWACVGHDRQLEVGPGATRTDTLELSGPSAFDGATGAPFGTFDAQVRLVYGVQTCRGDGACLVPGAGASNAFNVRVAR